MFKGSLLLNLDTEKGVHKSCHKVKSSESFCVGVVLHVSPTFVISFDLLCV